MGFVHRARHLELDLLVAIKVVRPELARDPVVVARLLEEARAMGSVRSDHIVRVYDVDRLADGTPYLVLEFVDGPDLEQVLARHGALSSADVIEFALDICSGLGVAHGRGIVHRDIKPENLLVETLASGGHRIKISDFGIAKRTEEHRARSLTMPSVTVGSPYYMAPEQMRNASDIDGRADVWSLGVVLYELVTGRLPFGGATPAEVCSQVLSSTPERPRTLRDSIPARLEHVILRCLERDASHRYPDVVELARDLARIEVPAGAESRRLERVASTVAAGSRLALALAGTGETKLKDRQAAAAPSATTARAPEVPGEELVASSPRELLRLRVDEPPITVSNLPGFRPPRRLMLPSVAVALAVVATVLVEAGGPFFGGVGGSAPRDVKRGPRTAAAAAPRRPPQRAPSIGGASRAATSPAASAALPGGLSALVAPSESTLRSTRASTPRRGRSAPGHATVRFVTRRRGSGPARAPAMGVPEAPASSDAPAEAELGLRVNDPPGPQAPEAEQAASSIDEITTPAAPVESDSSSATDAPAVEMPADGNAADRPLLRPGDLNSSAEPP